jgi:hypothetical protein
LRGHSWTLGRLVPTGVGPAAEVEEEGRHADVEVVFDLVGGLYCYRGVVSVVMAGCIMVSMCCRVAEEDEKQSTETRQSLRDLIQPCDRDGGYGDSVR